MNCRIFLSRILKMDMDLFVSHIYNGPMTGEVFKIWIVVILSKMHYRYMISNGK